MTLPEREWKIVYLRFFRDLSQSEIAGELGISQMHVSRLLTRALERLRSAPRRRERAEPGPPGQ